MEAEIDVESADVRHLLVFEKRPRDRAADEVDRLLRDNPCAGDSVRLGPYIDALNSPSVLRRSWFGQPSSSTARGASSRPHYRPCNQFGGPSRNAARSRSRSAVCRARVSSNSDNTTFAMIVARESASTLAMSSRCRRTRFSLSATPRSESARRSQAIARPGI